MPRPRTAVLRPLQRLCRPPTPAARPPAGLRRHSTSVNPDEVAHFNALASSWWDPHGPSRLLHQMNPLRHDFIQQCLGPAEKTAGPAHILDIGCGGGIFAESAARLSTTASVTAMDPSAEVLAVARAHARRDPALARLRYVQSSVEEMVSSSSSSTSTSSSSSPPPPFDMISLFEVLEHVATDPGTFLAQCGQLLRPGGWLVGSTMARTWTSWLTTIVAAEQVLGIVPPGTHDWARYVNADELARYVGVDREAGPEIGSEWEALRLQGVAYLPGLGWQVVPGGEALGNYFFGIRKRAAEQA